MNHDMILQINVPLCVRRCAHCGLGICRYDADLGAAYAKALVQEIGAVAEEFEDRTVRAVSIEGGSPALLAPGDLQAVLRTLRRGFALSEDVQISLQTMPGDYSRALMEKMRDNGVNLWRVGLATADLREHELLRRPYRFDALTMVDMAVRTFQPRDLCFEVVVGLPGQTSKSWAHTLETALAYAPDCLLIQPLDLTVNSALRADCDLGLIEPLSAQALDDLRGEAHERLTRLGYETADGVEYALPGKGLRFERLKRAGVERLGIGYLAETVMDGYRYINGHSLNEYLAHPGELDVLAAEVRAISPGEA